MANTDHIKYRETLIVIVLGFSILSLILEKDWLLFAALGTGVAGMLSMQLNRWIHLGWFFIGEKLGFVVSKIILGAVFYLVLLPMAGLSKLFRKDLMNLKPSDKSGYHRRDHLYNPEDFENMW